MADLHIDTVYIGPLFAVHLHRDKIVGHQLSDLGIGKGLALHHVTPVAGGVADGEKNGFVLAFCLVKRGLSPRIPIDGIGGMLEQIRALFKHEAIVVLTAIGRQLGQFRLRRQGMMRLSRCFGLRRAPPNQHPNP